MTGDAQEPTAIGTGGAGGPGAAAGPGTCGAAGGDVRITFARSGGVAGLCLACTVDTAELDDATRRRLLEQLAGLDLPSLAQAPPPPGRPVPDRFSYDLVVETGGERFDLSYGERGLPDGLRPLVQDLLERSRRRPPQG